MNDEESTRAIDDQNAAMREDVSKALNKALMPPGEQPLHVEVAEYLIEAGWRHPEIGER